ncbi:glycosyltransferase family 4 protein [Nonomuraea sp. NPDC050310]|uniref:glycosyltransferase family 4 protein n=1 Tax=unclassified Nonomuraea TaxID=2593643 RepID=UPI0033FD8CC9
MTRSGGPNLGDIRVAVLNFREPLQSVAGGAEEYAWQVARYLAEQGAGVHFVTSRERGQVAAERVDGIELRRMGNRYLVYLLVPLWLLLRRRRFDLVVDAMNGIPFFAPLVVRRRTKVISLVHHVHQRQFYAFLPKLVARVCCFVEGPLARRLYRRCTTVTVSESSRRGLRERLGWIAPIQVIHNGVRVVPSGVEPTGEPVITYVGRLVGHKRIEQVVELAETLRPQWPDLRVHVIGRGPEYANLADLVARRSLGDRVTLHGFVPEEDKNRLLGESLLHVMPSEWEGWGLTVIEAAGQGVPTVAYDVGGLRDSVRDGITGWLVREDDTLANVVDRSLKRLTDPVLREETARQCRQWADSFHWERTGEAFAHLIVAELAEVRATRLAKVSRLSAS